VSPRRGSSTGVLRPTATPRAGSVCALGAPGRKGQVPKASHERTAREAVRRYCGAAGFRCPRRSTGAGDDDENSGTRIASRAVAASAGATNILTTERPSRRFRRRKTGGWAACRTRTGGCSPAWSVAGTADVTAVRYRCRGPSLAGLETFRATNMALLCGGWAVFGVSLDAAVAFWLGCGAL
jgi:hypothetical protein